ncbi:hypothetical protein WOLCODRAFT_25771 [Wolfiporia cocos MD-104 SS10]|uniref:Yeast cell wall synthesis Kre9/Knh1-like N-terminal domain-containing protein n=1 Tax=Wolfiporia cocos (strain MD-104) TaxID=742152 RepID=A0A2H3JT98_WOLCO|nr:hypothetical protein WOLCODRAFT_25771 [Wolfiporia cocos MD-104 SS10]
MRFALAALALLPVAALAEITITGPSASEYWVQYTSNTITWTYSSGDPSPIDIVVFNEHNVTLDGNFSIAQYVDVSTQSFTVTNVTLVVGDDYAVQFVSPLNHSVIYATSQYFSLMAPGTKAAPTSAAASASASASGSGTASGSAASGTSPSTSSGSASATHSSSASSRNLATSTSQAVYGLIAACGIASLSSLLL